MARSSEGRRQTWIAFAAGAVAMLALVLVLWLWRTTTGAENAAGEIVGDVVVPDIAPLRIPPAPPIPDGPVPAPR